MIKKEEKMKFNVLGPRVLAKISQEDNKTASGITLSMTDNSNVQKARVVALGNEVLTPFIDLNDEFLYEEHTAIKINFENNNYILIDIQDILLVFKEEK